MEPDLAPEITGLRKYGLFTRGLASRITVSVPMSADAGVSAISADGSGITEQRIDESVR